MSRINLSAQFEKKKLEEDIKNIFHEAEALSKQTSKTIAKIAKFASSTVEVLNSVKVEFTAEEEEKEEEKEEQA